MIRPKPLLSQIECDTVLENMARVGNLARAAKPLGRSADAVKKHALRFPDFAEQLEQARLEFCGRLEDAAVTRAVDGVPKGIWHQGVRCGTEQVYSDGLLAKLLEANIDKYRSKSHIAIEDVSKLSPVDKAARIAAVLDKVRQREGAAPAIDDDELDGLLD